MLGHYKLIIDTHCDVYDLIKNYADEIFWNFENHDVVPDAIYIIGREQFRLNAARIVELTERGVIRPVLCNPVEGSETIVGQIKVIPNVTELVLKGQILIIGGGDMESKYPYLRFDWFLTRILKYQENITAQQQIGEIYSKQEKPYKFLFLNGRVRPHRKYLIERFDQNGLLNQSLWTNLDTASANTRHIKFEVNGEDLLRKHRNVQLLPEQYEVETFKNNVNTNIVNYSGFIKMKLFDNHWGDIYINPLPYIDTYFSLVTETVFNYPWSFRTEKIWKPVVMEHPFVAVANYGYYRDLHNLGFKTFSHLINEDFDLIDNSQDRIERIAEIVEDLCQQDLNLFLQQAQSVCNYNRHMLESISVEEEQKFIDNFFKFIKQYFYE